MGRTSFTCVAVLLLCTVCFVAVAADQGESENGTLTKAWSHSYGYIWYHVYPIAPSPAVVDLGFGGPALEVVSGNEEYYAYYTSEDVGPSGEWYCFDASGNILWTRDTTNDEARTSPVIADIDGDGDYEIGGSTTSGCQFQMMDHTGNFLWRYPVDYYSNNPTASALADVFTQTGESAGGEMEMIGASLNGILYCLDADPSDGVDDGLPDYYPNYTGDQTDVLWKFETHGLVWQWVYNPATSLWEYSQVEGPSKIFSAPAVSDLDGDGTKEIVIGCAEGKVYCIRGSDGEKVWEYHTGERIRSSAALADVDGDGNKEVFIGSFDTKVYCFSSAGVVQWSFATGGIVDSSPTIADLDGDGKYELVVGSWDKKVYCLNAETGALKWSVATSGAVLSSATPANRTGGRLDIYICSNDGFLYLINGTTGVIMDRFYAGARIQSSPTVADIDGDGHLEVLFMDWAADNISESGYWDGTGDVLWCLRDVGSQVSPYQIEWPMFRGDACHTGVYTKAYTPSAQPLPALTAQANPVTGQVPLTVTLSMTVSTDGSISKYEWDFGGNGTYDWSSTQDGNTTTTYTAVGNYSATARVTDNLGQVVTNSVEIVVVNALSPPIASIQADPTSGATPLMVQLNGTGEDSDGEILLYEWDFDGDGSYNYSSTSSGQVVHIYSEAGTFTARLRVTDDGNMSDTAEVTINVMEANNPPAILANANPSSGEAPLEVVLTAVGNDEDGEIVLWEWDFEGDGIYDWSSDTSELSGTTTHIYSEVGTYNATVRATDDGDLTSTASAQVVVSEPSNFKVWISKPKTGQSLSGSAVSIRVQTAPGASATDHVEIQWRRQGDSEWQILTEVYPPPYSFYDASLDVTGFDDGQVLDLRALGYHVDGTTTVVSPIITVSVDSTDPDVAEAPNGQGEHHKKQKVFKSQDNEIVVTGGFAVAVGYGTLDANTHLEITLKNGNPFPADGSSDKEAGVFVNIELLNVESFNQPLTITLPYQDADNDGFEDTTGIAETEIKMYTYNEATGVWEVLPSNSVNAAENTVTAKTPHLSNFGLFVGDPGQDDTPPPPSGGGGCFLSTSNSQ